jgi:hypothetical protein
MDKIMTVHRQTKIDRAPRALYAAVLHACTRIRSLFNAAIKERTLKPFLVFYLISYYTLASISS